MSKPVLDISKYQTITDWSAVKRSISGVIVRLGYRGYGSSGTLVEDPKFYDNAQACIRYGIPLGVYFFPTSVSDAEAIEEANFIIQRIKDIPLSFPIFLDSEKAAPAGETGRSDNLTPAVRTHLLNVIIDRLITAGYNAGIYASTSWLNNQLSMSNADERAYIWCAQYANKCTYEGLYHMWQYRSDGTISGVSGRCDLSNIILDMPGGRRTDPEPTPTPEPTPEPTPATGDYIDVIVKNSSGTIILDTRAYL